MRWIDLRRGQSVKFYTASGWKSGVVSNVYEASCSVTWSAGSANKTTRVYDIRNIKPA